MKKIYLASAVIGIGSLLSGCGAPTPVITSSPTASGSATNTVSNSKPNLVIKISGDKISPTNLALNTQLGKPFRIKVVSDRVVNLHIHSKPEVQLKFKVGKSQKSFTPNVPGVILIEDHDTDTAIAKVEAK